MSFDLPLVPNSLARFIQRWASKRLPETDYEATLVRQRIYILPNRSGIVFFIILLAILLGAVNYENSLGYMLTFLLGSVGFLGMFYAHQNLNHLKLSASNPKPVFAGQLALFPVNLCSTKKASHLNVMFQSKNGEAVAAHVTKGNNDTRVLIPLAAEKRGKLALQQFKIFTEYPLGLFHAWSWVELQTSCLVYPKPDEHPLNLKYQGKQSGQRISEQTGNDDFAGIRQYQKGDAPSHLAWKAVARTGVLQTKLFHAEAGEEIILSWYQLPENMDIEKRLSVLCRWVLDADKHDLKYGLEIPQQFITPDSGLHHRQSCLKELALFGKQ
ncbi:MAG TPA: DUF58 domain-containing protein [Gammaproteobacteria bacterium]